MSKVYDLMEGRNQGLALALKLVEDGGIEDKILLRIRTLETGRRRG